MAAGRQTAVVKVISRVMHHAAAFAIAVADDQVTTLRVRIEHKGEIFAAHQRPGAIVRAGGAELLFRHAVGETGYPFVVDQHRRAVNVFHHRVSAEACRLRLDQRRNARQQGCARLGDPASAR